jgi:hypothetical protein
MCCSWRSPPWTCVRERQQSLTGLPRSTLDSQSFGSVAVRWADAHFAYRFASGAVPAAAPATGWKAVRFDFELWLRSIAGWIVAFALLEALVALVGNDAVTQPLRVWYKFGFGSVFFWFVFGPAWSLVFFRRKAR